MTLKIYMTSKPYMDRTEVYICDVREDGTMFLVQPMEMVFKLQSRDTVPLGPSLVIDGQYSREFFPGLVKALAESGYRYESSDAGELKATKVHLEDMRKLVFK